MEDACVSAYNLIIAQEFIYNWNLLIYTCVLFVYSCFCYKLFYNKSYNFNANEQVTILFNKDLG